jgi:hypothetical protein
MSCWIYSFWWGFKDIGFILFIKNGLKKICIKNYENYLISNNYDVSTAVAHCFPNILDVMVLENVNLSEDKIWRPPLWRNEKDSNFCHQSPTYAVISVYFKHTLISYLHWVLKCFISVRKLHDLPFTLLLWTEFSTCLSTNLKRRWLDLFCNYYHIQSICNYSTSFFFFFFGCDLSFCHIFVTFKILSSTYM